MKKLFSIFALTCALTVRGAVLDGLAAKVNDDVITIGELMAEFHRSPSLQERVSAARGDEASIRAIENDALDNLIDRRLILQAAAEKKMEMQDWVVDNRIREIVKDNYDADMNKLTDYLRTIKVPYAEFKNQLKEDMIIAAMRYQIVEKNLVASPVEMRKEYLENKSAYMSDAKTTVSVILLKPSSDDKTPSVSTRADEILARLEKGEKFSDLAITYSADSHAKDGGVWKDVKLEESFRPEICEVVEALKVGEHSKLVDLDGWGFIVRKDDVSAATAMSFSEAYEDIAFNIKQRKAKKAFAEWLKNLRAAAYVKKYELPRD